MNECFPFRRSPTLQINNLLSGVHYGVRMLAFNEKGESDGTRLPIYTLKNPEKQTDFIIPMAPVMEDIKPFLPIIYGALGGLLLIGLLIVVVVRSRSGGGRGDERNMNLVNRGGGAGGNTANQLRTGKENMNSWSRLVYKTPVCLPLSLSPSGQRREPGKEPGHNSTR